MFAETSRESATIDENERAAWFSAADVNDLLSPVVRASLLRREGIRELMRLPAIEIGMGNGRLGIGGRS